jgi:hypothetical protein
MSLWRVAYPQGENIPIFWVEANDAAFAIVKARKITALYNAPPPDIRADNRYSVKLDRDSE